MHKLLVDDSEGSIFKTGNMEEDSSLLSIADGEPVGIMPSQFVERAVMIPTGGLVEPFNFKGREYLRPIYDSDSHRIVIIAGRQVEKSTLLGNKILSYSILTPYFRSLYVSPSHQQTKTFSHDRVKDPIDISPFIRSFTNPKLLSNVLEKHFANGSKIVMRFAFLNADRCRGIAADLINIDEFQDILLDNVPVIEECASHSNYKIYIYSGTPKSLDGTLEYYYSRFSTQNEWVVPCKAHGTPKNKSSWFWNILSEDNIGKKGLICSKCGKSINARDKDAQWAAMNPRPNVKKPFEGYRISQLMVPWIEWSDILHKQHVYSRAKFYNEVLGRSFDSGTRPLTRQDIKDNCWDQLSMKRFKTVEEKYAGNFPIFMGVDWSAGSEHSYTVVSLAAYLPVKEGSFIYFYYHRFEGAESEPDYQIKKIFQLADQFKVAYIGVDYGGGFWPNDQLIRKYGVEKVKIYQWVGKVKRKIKYETGLGIPRYLCHRTEVMSDFFNGVKRRNVFTFPRWEEFEDPYAADFTNIFSEYSDRLHMNVYKHALGCPDDTAHSSIFCFLASFHSRPRPDVILPKKEMDYAASSDEDDSMEEMDIT